MAEDSKKELAPEKSALEGQNIQDSRDELSERLISATDDSPESSQQLKPSEETERGNDLEESGLSLSNEAAGSLKELFEEVKSGPFEPSPEASSDTDRLADVLAWEMTELGVEFSGGSGNRGVFGKMTMGDDKESVIYQDGKGQAHVAGSQFDFDLSSADKIFDATRASVPVIASSEGDVLKQANVDRMQLRADGIQKLELSGGDLLFRVPANPDGVNWIRDVGGENGDRSIIAYADGRREVRFKASGPEGVSAVQFGADGEILSLDRDSERSGVESAIYQGGDGFGSIKQTTDRESGVVVTEFADSDYGLKSITYNPASGENAYQVEFEPGRENPDLEQQIKSGQFRIPLSFHSEDGRPEGINLFPERWSSLENVDPATGQFMLGVDGTLRFQERGEVVEEPLEIEGESAKFAFGNEKGELITNPETGYVSGIRFESGNRSGQEYAFSYEEDGSLNRITVRVPSEGGKGRVNEVHLTRQGDDSWLVEPAGAGIPGFESLKIGADGRLSGNIVVKPSGDIVYDAGDGFKEAMRLNGTNDRYDLNSYERVRETAEGESATEYWDGYEWRQGTKESNEDGTVTVSFSGEGQVSKIVRDAGVAEDGSRRDRVLVVRNDGTVYDADWGRQHMSRQSGDKKVDLFNTGMRYQNDKAVWMQGSPSENGEIVFEPESDRERLAIMEGRAPKSVSFHEGGEFTSVYANNTRVRSDRSGRASRIDFGNDTHVQLDRDVHGGVLRVSGLDGRSYERSRQLPADESGQKRFLWNVVDGSEDDRQESIEASLVIGQQGQVSFRGGDNYNLSIEGSGMTVVRSGDRIEQVLDAQGQLWMPEKREDNSAEVWTVSSGERSESFEGSLELNALSGRATVKGKDGKFRNLNPDGSTRTYNQEGVEIERSFPDGSLVARSELGYLSAIKSLNADGTLVLREFVYEDGPEGQPHLKGVKLNGKPTEVVVDGHLRELKEARSSPGQINPENLGAYIDYDTASGMRIIKASLAPEDKTIRLEDIHGKFEVRDLASKFAEEQSNLTAYSRPYLFYDEDEVEDSPRGFDAGLV